MKCTFANGFVLIGLLSAAVLLPRVDAVATDNPETVSWSAENAAIQRAVAAMHPDEKVRCPDYLAEKFVTEANWHYSPYSRNYGSSIKLIRTYRVGSYYYTNALTHHLDRMFQEAAGRVRQVVDLNAGFNTQAYRFHEAMPEAAFFEVDRPANIALKQEMVDRHLKKRSAHVVYVPAGPERERLEAVLKGAGYDERVETLFIWTGATYHLSDRAVASTLEFVARHSAPGSRIVFDYIPAQTLKSDAARRTRFRLALAGEPLTFGIPETGVAAYLSDRGLLLASDLGAKELQEQYLVLSDLTFDGAPSPIYRVAVAEVPSAAAGADRAGAGTGADR